jgi:NAD(P)-dependent dehydrogenase (short-subunit alcohol dehydrogenase family)
MICRAACLPVAAWNARARAALLALLATAAGSWPQAVPAAAAPVSTADSRSSAIPAVLITGSNRGIGLELARQYAARGWSVIATARRPAEAVELQKIAAAHPSTVAIEPLDVADAASVEALAGRLAGRPIDLLLHNAGISGGVPNQVFGRMNYDAFREVLEVNTIGPLKLTESLLPNVLASQQKKVVLIGTSEASFASIDAGRLYWYRSSKAAAHMLMLNLAFELKPKGVAVGVINPGPVDTDMMKGARMPLQPPAESVGKVIGIIDRLDVANTGRFWDYGGGELPW